MAPETGFPVAPPGDAGHLELIVDRQRILVSPRQTFTIGRGGAVDLDLAHPSVSRQHAILECEPDGWSILDTSRNGVFIDGERIARHYLRAATTVRLGAREDGIDIRMTPTADIELRDTPPGLPNQGQLSGVYPLEQAVISIGRMPDNDIVVDDLLVSRRHAELRRVDEEWRIFDLSSANGTYVNGRRINDQQVTESDIIGVGHSLLQLRSNELVAFVDVGDNAFEARDLSVSSGRREPRLQHVSFELSGQSLVAVIGPSGAGKSTLLGALTGTHPADHGEVLYAGRDLYRDYAELRNRIGVVPQDDVLHTQLTVRQALSYAARLRFPNDTSRADRSLRVEEVLQELDLVEQAEQRIDTLSGGQRKRTSVALELLTKPSLLFLDEPTSGLDPGMDRSVMRTLRSLADDGRTVVVVTHNAANLKLCDRLLVLAKGGWRAYFGSPEDALIYFEQTDFDDIFTILGNAPGEEWARRFEEAHQSCEVIPPAGRVRPAAQLPDDSSRPPASRPVHQFWVLALRYLSAIRADRQYVAFSAVLPLLLSLLARAVPGSAGLSANKARIDADTQPQLLLLILIIGAALMGAAGAVRELVKERPIYMRESAIGLSAGAYLASKVVVLGVVTAIQASVFTFLSTLGRDQPDDPLVITWSGRSEILIAVVAVAVTSMLIGLLISALIDNADRGMPLLILVIMIQLTFCGGLFPVHDRPVLEQISWLVPAQWGFSMTAATADLSLLAIELPDLSWSHDVSVWYGDFARLLTIAAVLYVAIFVVIKRSDPQRKA